MNTISSQKKQQKIAIIGGPGTGKSTAINALKAQGYFCFEEVSRAVTLKAQKEGVDQLFLTQPLLFSELLLKGREEQYLQAIESGENTVFFDRGIPDVHAYMNYFNSDYPPIFLEKSKIYRYDVIFHFSPWEEIYVSDNERYETFEDSVVIDRFLLAAYKDLGYKIINVPFGSLEERVAFILNALAFKL